MSLAKMVKKFRFAKTKKLSSFAAGTTRRCSNFDRISKVGNTKSRRRGSKVQDFPLSRRHLCHLSKLSDLNTPYKGGDSESALQNW